MPFSRFAKRTTYCSRPHSIPADLHNTNRPRPGGNSHELAVAGIRRAKDILGADRVGALMTTTEASLDRVDDIIDEYLKEGFPAASVPVWFCRQDEAVREV